MKYAIYKSPNSNGKIIPIESKEQIAKLLGNQNELKVIEGLINETIIIGKHNKGEINFIYKTQNEKKVIVQGDCIIIKGVHKDNLADFLSEEEAKALLPLFNDELLKSNFIEETINELQVQFNMLKIEMAMRGLFINEYEDEEEDMDL